MTPPTADLVELFDELPPPAAGEELRFQARPIPAAGALHIAKDPAGRPALLIESGPDGPPVALAALQVRHGVECVLEDPGGGSRPARLSVVHCTGRGREIQELFLRALPPVIAALGPYPPPRAVAAAVDGLVDLFRTLAHPPRKSIQGLWAELFVISHAEDPAFLLRAWHVRTDDFFDFCAGAQRIEVKSATDGRRVHRFSLEQLSPPPATDVLVASVLLEADAAGEAVPDLVDRLRGLVADPTLLVHLDRVVAHTLGNGWQRAAEFRYDRAAAARSLCFYCAGDIPAIRPPLPTEVSQVKFASDVTRARQSGGGWPPGTLFRAALPR